MKSGAPQESDMKMKPNDGDDNGKTESLVSFKEDQTDAAIFEDTEVVFSLGG